MRRRHRPQQLPLRVGVSGGRCPKVSASTRESLLELRWLNVYKILRWVVRYLPFNTSEKWGRALKRLVLSQERTRDLYPRRDLPGRPTWSQSWLSSATQIRYLKHTGRLQQTCTQVLLHARARAALRLVLIIPGHGGAHRPRHTRSRPSVTPDRPKGRGHTH